MKVPPWQIQGNGSGASKPNRPWHYGSPTTGRSRAPLSKNVKRGLALAALAVLCLFIGVVIQWLSPFKTCLVVIGSGYETNLFLPHNVHGRNGLTRLHLLAREEVPLRYSLQQPEGIRRVLAPFELATDNTWADIWREVRKDIARHHEETVIIAISLHGYADKDDVFLLAKDANPQKVFEMADGSVPAEGGKGPSRVSFQEILNSLKELHNKKIVLLLDVCQIQSHWPTGLLKNDVVGKLSAKYQKTIDDMQNLVVLCAAGVDQRAWVSDEWQNSMFLHYAAEGLRGVKQEGRVSARHLYEYIRDSVQKWASSNRARNQEVVLLGEKNLAGIEILFVDKTVAEEELPGRDTDANLTALRAQWETWQKRRELAPFAYAPHVWRLYQETLLRFEQLLRAGDPTGKAELLQKRLAELGADIDNARTMKEALGCQGFSMPMARVLGNAPPISLLTEWDPDRDAPQKILAEQLGHEANLPQPYRTVETHLLKMLCDGGLPDLDKKDAKLAVATRMRAEQAVLSAPLAGELPAYLYGEVIFPWVRDRVAELDKDRRRGEDLLFGEAVDDRREARRFLESAATGYRDLQRTHIRPLREALAVYDEACADVLCLGQWLAMTPPRTDTRKLTEANFRKLPDLGDGLRRLREVCKGPDTKLLRQLPNLTAAVKDIRDAICEQYHDRTAELRPLGFQNNWHQFDNALTVPPPFSHSKNRDIVNLRLQLLQYLHEESVKLAQKKAEDIHPEDEDPERVERLKAVWQSCLKPFDLPGTRENFLALPKKINDCSHLEDAANWCRVVPAGLIEQVDTQHPVDRLRRQRLQVLLEGQAERTWLDHWFEPGQAGREEPYYKPAAEGYVLAACALTDDRDGLKQRWQEKLQGPQRLQIAVESEKFWLSTQREMRPRWFIRAEGTWLQARDGSPMYWLKSHNLSKRKAYTWHGKAIDDFALTDLDRTSKPELHVLFRGQRLTQEVGFLEKKPDVIVRDILPRQSALAVRLHDKFNFGAVSILMDNSLSMLSAPGRDERPGRNEPPKLKVGEKTRFMHAIEALDDVLRHLPDGTKLSMFVFHENLELPGETGVQVFKGASIARDWMRVQLDEAARGELIAALRKKLKEAETDNSWFFHNSPIARGLRECKKAFPESYAEPKVILALSDGYPDNCSFVYDKNREEDNEENNSPWIRKNLPAALGKGIDTVFVCFMDQPKTKKEKARADNKLKILRDQFDWLNDPARTGKSALKPQADPRKLGTAILDILRPRLKLTDDQDRPVPGFSDDEGNGLLIPPFAAKVNWLPIPPGTYHAELPRVDHSRQNVGLAPPQNLLLVLKRQDQGRTFFLERGLLFEQMNLQDRLSNFSQVRNEWQVSLLSHEVGSRNELDQRIIFENRNNSGPGAVGMPRPGFVWLELQAKRKGLPIKLQQPIEWENDPDVAAPGYRLKVSQWQRYEDQPELTAWFCRDLVGSFVTRQRLPLANPDGFKVPGIDGVRWEKHKNLNDEFKDVLVVHGRFLREGEPLMALLELGEGRRAAKAEHFYFNDVGRFTTYFHGVPGAADANLVLVNLARFKQEADRDKVIFTPSAQTPIEPWPGAIRRAP